MPRLRINRGKAYAAGVVAAAATGVYTLVFMAFLTVAPRGASPWWAVGMAVSLGLAVAVLLLPAHFLQQRREHRAAGRHGGKP